MTDTSAGTVGPIAPSSLHALTRAAVEATGSVAGWLLWRNDDSFTVVTRAGGARPEPVRRPLRGAAGMVVASGQPAALLPGTGDEPNHGAAGIDAVPGALLVVPCAARDLTGVLELGRAEPENYSFDDLELAVLLGEIAGVMLEELSPARDDPAPDVIGHQLTALAGAEPDRYRDIVRTIGWMLR